MCLMGDPGVAKSQLLGYIDRLAPRSKLLMFTFYFLPIIIVIIKYYLLRYNFNKMNQCK